MRLRSLMLAMLLSAALSGQLSAQSVCTADCTVARGEAYSVVAAVPSTANTVEYRIYVNGLDTGEKRNVSAVANGEIVFSFPSGIAPNVPDGTYDIQVGAANGIVTGAIVTLSPILRLTVVTPVNPPAPGTPFIRKP
jgi:hypothetical protein